MNTEVHIHWACVIIKNLGFLTSCLLTLTGKNQSAVVISKIKFSVCNQIKTKLQPTRNIRNSLIYDIFGS